MRLKNIPALILLLQIIVSPFAPLGARANANAMNEGGREASEAAQEAGAVEKKGLRFRLSEGAEQSEAAGPRAPAAPAVKLSEAETARVLARLPELKDVAGDRQEFALRERSLPAPRAGATVLRPFPAPETREAPDAAASGEQVVVRHSPTGEVPIAPQVSLTFSRPAVAVTSQDEAARTVPARLSPEPAGRWRWLGTKTLIFDPAEGRLPMATEFEVSVPAGAAGAGASKPLTWKFATPAPKLVAKYPEGVNTRRDAVVFMEFDQRVDPASVLRTLKLTAGSASPALRLAKDDEIAADENVSRLVKAATAGRWLAVRATGAGGEAREALPADSPVTVTVGAGTPSAEGPRRTAAAQSFSFRTYGPFRVTSHACGWNNRCAPSDQWIIQVSNPVDLEAFDASKVKVEPEVPGLNVNAYGTTIYIHGAKRGRTTYRVTLDPTLRDQFGQTLGSPVTVSFSVGPAPPSLMSVGGNFVVLDPAGGPHFSVYSVNHAALKVSLYAVEPKDYEAYVAHMRSVNGYYDEKRPGPVGPPGRLVSSKSVAVKGQSDELTETRLDLSEALKGGRGNVCVIVEPTTKARGNAREVLRAWVQMTGIGLDAFVDREDLVGWATALSDGRPLEGVEMTLLPSGQRAASGGDGLVRLGLPAPSSKSGALSGMLLARRGDETAFLPELSDWWYGASSWARRAAPDALRWYVFDDRKMYKPGEEVSLKGWLRRVGGGKGGDLGPLAGGAASVTYALRDSRGNEVLKGSAPLNALGGFDTKFKLPGTMNLGHSYVQLQAEGPAVLAENRQHQHAIQVQEFRRPEFEVSAKADEGPHFVGGHTQATVSANYYAGGGLPDSEVNWRVTATQTSFTPPNRGDYTFGRWTPWWETSHTRAGPGENAQTFKGRTDAAGKHTLRIDFDSVNPPQPTSVSAQASVTDVNRQAWTSNDDAARPPVRPLRRAQERAPLRAAGPAARRLDDSLRPRRPYRRRARGAFARGAARMEAGTRELDAGRGAGRGVRRQVGRGRGQVHVPPEGGRRLPRDGARLRRPRAPQRERVDALGRGREDAAAPKRRAGEGRADSRPQGVPRRRHGRDTRAGPLLPGRGPCDAPPLGARPHRALPHERAVARRPRPHRGGLHAERLRAG